MRLLLAENILVNRRIIEIKARIAKNHLAIITFPLDNFFVEYRYKFGIIIDTLQRIEIR